jgi:hypothetical protein
VNIAAVYLLSNAHNHKTLTNTGVHHKPTYLLQRMHIRPNNKVGIVNSNVARRQDLCE